jgi:hypothetical protein
MTWDNVNLYLYVVFSTLQALAIAIQSNHQYLIHSFISSQSHAVASGMFVTRPKWRPPKTPIAVPAVSILPDFHRHGLNNYRFFHSTPSKASAFDRRTSQEQSGNFRDAPNTPSRAVRRIIGRSSKHRDESSGDPGIRRIGLHQSDRRDGGRGNTGPVSIASLVVFAVSNLLITD